MLFAQPITEKVIVPTRPWRTQQTRQRNIDKLSVIIPCYNEAGTIALLLEKVVAVQLIDAIEKEIIVIDDCSTDGSDGIIQDYISDFPSEPIIFFRQDRNQGKGAAIKTGLSAATGDYFIVQDADLEYNPGEYNLLLEPIISGDADMVYGSRFAGGHPHRVLFFWHTVGNKILTGINNALTNTHLTDAHTCYKIMRTGLARSIPLRETRFAFDAELNVKVAGIPGIRIYEVGISYYGRTFAQGKKIRFHDAIRTMYCLFKYTVFTRHRKRAEATTQITNA